MSGTSNINESFFMVRLRSWIGNIRRDYRNLKGYTGKPTRTMIELKLRKPPWKLNLSSGQKVEIGGKDELFGEIFKFFHRENYQDDFVLNTRYRGKVLRLKTLNNGDIFRAFVNGDYEELPVENATVVDIGGSIGDSALLFAGRGASKVYAYELFPRSFELARFNVSNNGLDDVITFYNNGVGRKSTLKLDPDYINHNSSTSNHSHEKGVTVQVKTISEILEDLQISQPMLKIDCEGCEYDALLNEDRETLRKFSHIIMEYHYGYLNIRKKLEAAGFKVTQTYPNYMRSRDDGSNRALLYGYLFAVRLN